MPDISYEALAGAALVIVLAVGYQYLPKADDAGGPGGSSGKSKKKNKKKAKGGKSESAEEGSDRSATEVVKKGVDEVKKAASGKKDKAKPTSTPAAAPPPITPETSAPSFAEVAAEESEAKEEKPKPKTLAQKIAPKNRKSKVDDMLAPEDRPAEHARVMKVVQNGSSSAAPPAEPEPKQSEKIAKYEDDYQEGDDTSGTGTIEDDGWDVVPSKKKKTFSISNSASPAATSAPLPVDTKIQRKNAKKSEDKKAIKDAEEADRLKRLAQHKKGLEKERITEIYKNGKKGASGKTNGGAFASLDTNGKLVWE